MEQNYVNATLCIVHYPATILQGLVLKDLFDSIDNQINIDFYQRNSFLRSRIMFVIIVLY